MAQTGVLRTWHDERGFGFIAPTHGGPEVFVHITAFPADGSRPVPGERLHYDTALGPAGRPQAVRVWRSAVGREAAAARRPAAAPQRGAAPRKAWLALGLLVAAGALAWLRWAPAPPQPADPLAALNQAPPAAGPAASRGGAPAPASR